MVERRINELKVGIFVLLGIFLLIALVFALQGWLTTGRGYEITILFPNASGLQAGAPVRLAGVEVGRVVDVSLTPDMRAQVKMRLRKDVSIYSNYSLKIAVPVFGERYIEIKPAEPRGRRVERGETVMGQVPISFEDMVDDIQSLMGTFEEGISSFQETTLSLLKEDVKMALKQAQILLSDATAAVDNISRLSEDADKILQASGENIEGTTSNLEEAMGFLRDLFGESKENIVQATKNLRETSSELHDRLASLSNQLEGALQDVRKATVKSETIAGNIESASLSLEKTMANLESITADIKQLTANEEFIQNIQESVKSAREALEEAKTLLGEASRRVKGLGKLEVVPKASLTFNEEKENLRLSSQLLFPHQRFLIGFWDIGESNNLDLQRIWKRGDLELRGGLVHSKPGIGIDYPPYTSLNLYDLNDPRGDLYLNMGKNPFLQMGVEDIFSRNEFIWGIGYDWRK